MTRCSGAMVAYRAARRAERCRSRALREQVRRQDWRLRHDQAAVESNAVAGDGKKTRLCRFGDMCWHVQFTVQLDTEVADRRRWLNDVCPHVQWCDGRWQIT